MSLRILICCLAISLLGPMRAVSATDGHPFSIADDIAMYRFSDPLGEQADVTAKLSPDGQHFAVVTSRGQLRTDQVESTLWLFDSGDVVRYLRSDTSRASIVPRRLAMSSAVPNQTASHAYGSIITEMHWAEDSHHIYFISENVHGDNELAVVDIRTGDMRVLSSPGYNVSRYDVSGDTVVYSAWNHTKAGAHRQDTYWGVQINQDARDIANVAIANILFPYGSTYITAQTPQLWVVRNATKDHQIGPVAIRQLPRNSNYMAMFDVFQISPKGDKLITLFPISNIPVTWKAYLPAVGEEHMAIRDNTDPSLTAPDNPVRAEEYSMVDLQSGKLTSLTGAPYGLLVGYGDFSKAVWSPDEHAVLLTNTFLPLDDVSSAERRERLHPCSVAVVMLRPKPLVSCVVYSLDGSIRNANGLSLESMSFGSGDGEVLLRMTRADQSEETKTFEYRDAHWAIADKGRAVVVANDPAPKAAIKSSAEASRLIVSVKQSLNEPPTLWATDKVTGQSSEIWDPNPQLKTMRFGAASVYRWKDETGYEWKGGLVLPVNYVPGRRYPLVIQIYSFREDNFMTSGQDSTAFAARALADAGIAVLQIQRKTPITWNAEDADAHLRAFQSAIDSLAERGLIDRARVGAVGFSWTCWYVENALIKAPHLFAAATIADGTDHSYMSYHLWGLDGPGIPEQDERINGAPPIGDGLKLWFAQAPGFHLDQIKTPLRIEAIRPTGLLGEWEIYSSLVMQHKPVDLIYFPDGEHIHQRPLERFASQQGDVDWFRYWLQDYVDPNPSKAVEYQNWTILKTLSGKEPDRAQ